MRARTDAVGRPLGLLLAALAVVVLSVALVLGRRAPDAGAAEPEPARFAGARTVVGLPSILPEASLGAPVSVAILRDPASDAYFDGPARLDSVVADWRRRLEDIGARVHVVDPRGAASSRDDVLLVPSTPCLGAESRGAVDAALAAGRGVVVTWLTGTRDGDCTSVGPSLLVRLTGAMRMDTLETRPETYVSVPSGGPLAAAIPPGARIELVPAPFGALRLPGRDALYTDRLSNPEPVAGRPLLDGAIAHATHDRGRVVYWGFDPMRAVDRPWTQGVLALLVRNTVAWAAGRPLAALEPWPAGHRAAAVLSQDVESRFENARHALDSLRAAGVPATYFLVSDFARQHPELTRDLAAHGEIATHSDDHRLLGGMSAATQARRLERTQADLRALVGRSADGLRPPEEQFDLATIRAWLDAGGSYLFGANDVRTASPELLAVDGDTIVLLARATDDDFVTVAQARGTEPARLATRHARDVEKVAALGGLYILSYHSQLLARPELVPALATLARELKADTTIWLTTTGGVARWWRARHGVVVRSDRSRPGEVTVTLENRGAETVADAVVRLALPSGTAVAGASVPLLPAERGAARLVAPTLPPGASRSIVVELSGGSDAPSR